MKRFKWQIVFGLSLLLLSAAIYIIHFAIFRDAHYIFKYLIGHLAFLPIHVLLVTIVIDQLLRIREKRSLLKKMNMVIGAFFSEVGTTLLKLFSSFDLHFDMMREIFVVTDKWSEHDFSSIVNRLKEFDFKMESKRGDLILLKSFLTGKRTFLLGLLENPNLLEHESFTDLLWAVFHLTEELDKRLDLTVLPGTDYIHLSGDIKRAYVLLISEWLSYMKHLKDKYPYLFSLAVRTNPFDPNASPEVK
jgi:hypothetical protein